MSVCTLEDEGEAWKDWKSFFFFFWIELKVKVDEAAGERESTRRGRTNEQNGASCRTSRRVYTWAMFVCRCLSVSLY